MKAKHILLIVILFFCRVSLDAQNQALDFLKSEPHEGNPTIEETVSWLNEKWLGPIHAANQTLPVKVFWVGSNEVDTLFLIPNDQIKLSISNQKEGYRNSTGKINLYLENTPHTEPGFFGGWNVTIFLMSISSDSIFNSNNKISFCEWRFSKNSRFLGVDNGTDGVAFASDEYCGKARLRIIKKIEIPLLKTDNYETYSGKYYDSKKIDWNENKFILEAQIKMAFNYLIGRYSEEYRWCVYGACVAGKTQINLNKNISESIDKLKIGDSILSCSIPNKQYFQTTITGIDSVYHNNLVELHYENDTITCTDDHPFFINHKGWCSLNPEKTMRNYSNYPKVNLLEKGDSFISSSGSGITTIKLEDIKFLTKGEMTYTITGLKKGNTYFANGILTGVEIIENPF